jgi:hypothetical protein
MTVSRVLELGAGPQQPRTLAAPTRSGPPARLVVKRPSLEETVAGSALNSGLVKLLT